MRAVLALFCLFYFSLPLLAAGLTAEMARELISSSFPGSDQDASLYTVRYLSQQPPAGSEDGPACLQDQLHNGPTNITYCNTLRYSLTGQMSDVEAYNISHLVVVVSPGTYVYKKMELYNSSNIIIAGIGDGEVVLRCEGYSHEHNNIYIASASNLAFVGATFSHCGPLSPGLSIQFAVNITVDGCTFRYVSGKWLSRSPMQPLKKIVPDFDGRVMMST